MTTCPQLVHRYEVFDDATNPFDPIKLLGAISNPKDYNATEHGVLTAVVSYKLP